MPFAKNPMLFVLLTVLIDTMGFGIIMPVLPQLIMEVAGTDVAGATRIGGLLLVVFAGLQFLFGPVMGNLSDAYGRRPVLLISLFTFGINYALMGFAPNLLWLFAGRALTGLAGAIYAPANAYIADVTHPDKRAQSFGMIGAAFGLGFILGPALGGFLGELGPRAPFFAAGGLAVLNFLYGLLVLPESLPKERRRPFSIARANPLGSLRALRSTASVLPLALTAFTWQLAFHVYPATWAFYAMAKFQLGSRAIGSTLALSGMSTATVQVFLTGRIVKRLGELRAAQLGALTGASVFLGYALITESWMLFPILALGGLQGITMPSLNALMSKALGPERQGELQGAIASLMGLSSIIGPLSLTQTLAHFTRPHAQPFFPGAAFVLAGSLAALCLALLIAQQRRGPLARRPSPSAADGG
jgi:MFS transporter, DHA1 family, tetracycline resistance protein